MKKIAKNSFYSVLIILAALMVFGASFIFSTKLKRIRDTKRVENMYHLFSTKGKLHTERNSYTYLTEIGKKRLNSNLSFDKKSLPNDTLTAYSEEKMILTPYYYEGELKLPENPKKGQRLYFKVPFPITINENLKLTIFYKNNPIKYDSTDILLKKQKKKELAYIYLGESSDSSGKLIDDISKINKQPGQKVRFKIQNFERSFDRAPDHKLVRHPNMFYSGEELLNNPEITFKVGYHVQNPKFHWVIPEYSSSDLSVQVVSNEAKNYERYIRIKIKPRGKFLNGIKSNLDKDYQFSLLYNGLVIKDQYYITNNLSALSNYNHGK